MVDFLLKKQPLKAQYPTGQKALRGSGEVTHLCSVTAMLSKQLLSREIMLLRIARFNFFSAALASHKTQNINAPTKTFAVLFQKNCVKNRPSKKTHFLKQIWQANRRDRRERRTRSD